MGAAYRVTPAFFRRAFFVSTLAAASAVLAGPPPSAAPPSLAQVGKPNATETARILAQFRQAGWHGYVEFELHALPRRGDEVVYRGRLWGGQNEQGAITRIELTDAKGGVHRLLLQNGEHASLWRLEAGKVEQVGAAGLFDPLIPGVEVTPFDLQMPYLYWPGATVVNVARVRGRPAYEFVFNPPSGFAGGHSPVQSVHAFFDAQYGAPVETQLTDGRKILKTTSLLDLKKVGEQWIPKSYDVRNEETRDKTRFLVTAVALNLDFGATVFAPAALMEDIRAPGADRIVRIEQ